MGDGADNMKETAHSTPCTCHQLRATPVSCACGSSQGNMQHVEVRGSAGIEQRYVDIPAHSLQPGVHTQAATAATSAWAQPKRHMHSACASPRARLNGALGGGGRAAQTRTWLLRHPPSPTTRRQPNTQPSHRSTHRTHDHGTTTRHGRSKRQWSAETTTSASSSGTKQHTCAPPATQAPPGPINV